MDLDPEDLLSLAIESVEKEAIVPSLKSNTKCSTAQDLVKNKDTEGSLSVLKNNKNLFEEDEENILAEALESIENEKPGKKKRSSLIGVDLCFEDIAPENLFKEIDNAVKNSVVHSGDTDSSDDEDNKYFEEARYDSYGKSIKKALQGAQKVVGPSSAVINRESSWKAKPSIKPTQSGFTVPETVGSNKTQSSTFDPVFGIRIVNPLVSSQTIKEKMAGRTPISFMKLKAHVTHGDLKTDWVVAAVLVRKFPPRVSQKGSNYSNWLLSDLKGNLKTVLLFLFGRAHDELWKTPSGTVLAILNPSVLNDKKTSDYEAKLSINSGDQVMIWGRSKDLGQCNVRKKNGEICGSFVNVAECEFCVYHVKQEYKKYNSRSELQFSGNAQVNLRNKVLGKNEVFYGGKSFTAVGKKAHNPKDKERLKGLGMPQGPLKTPEEKVQIPVLQRSNKMFNLLPSGNALLPSKASDSERLSSLTSSKKNDLSVHEAKGKRPIEVKPNQEKTALCEKKPLLTNPGNAISFDLEICNEKLTPIPVTKMTMKENCKNKTSGASKNKLQKRFNSLLAISSSESDTGKKQSLTSSTLRDSVKGQSVNSASTKSAQKLSTKFVSNTHTPKEIAISKETNLPSVTTDFNKRFPSDSVKISKEPDNAQPELLNRSPLLLSKGNAPQGLAQITQRPMPSPKLPPNSGMSRAKLKALQFVKEKGPICKDNPSGSDQKKCLKRPLSPTPETENENRKPVLSERFLELMNQKSIHEDLVEMREMEQELEYFDKLEKKDRLEEKMLNTFKVDCKAVKCLKCNYTWFSVSEACKAEGHPTKVIDAIKRFFKCGKCSNRTVSLTIIPLIPCRKCFSTNWVRAPMIREKIAKSDNLSIRGGEQKFVNSVITNASLDLLVPD